ncbi:MAG: hypothetical protein IT307_13685, partial [Chloroflexi bacterium]|nr:hypothetical protein [Chloroflexota bacterium]
MRLAGALGFALALVLVAEGAPALEAQPATQPVACSYSQPFKALHDQLPEVVGYCVERERSNTDNGNTEQRTTNGLLVWRKSDGRVLFTNGVTTWIIGPTGLLSRPSDGPLFPWEQLAARPARTTEAAGLGPPVAEPPPGLGSVVLEDVLTSPGTFTPFRCPTGLGERSFTSDGYLLSVSGRCQSVDSAAGVIGSAPGLQVPDGDLRFEFRASGAVERVLVGARVR